VVTRTRNRSAVATNRDRSTQLALQTIDPQGDNPMAQMAHRQASVAAPRFRPRHPIRLAAVAAIALAAALPVVLISESNDISLDKAAPAPGP
jgi:hypothetical protein